MNPRAFQIHPSDSVAVLLDDAEPVPVSLFGSSANASILAKNAIRLGHKIAVRPHEANEAVTKFGVRVGHATAAIATGEWIHLQHAHFMNVPKACCSVNRTPV